MGRSREEPLADLQRAISPAGADSRVETLVRCYVNAAGGAYRSGRLDDAEKYVAGGLRAAADGEFFAGQYRVRSPTTYCGPSRWPPDTRLYTASWLCI